jgi:hypothetical protein
MSKLGLLEVPMIRIFVTLLAIVAFLACKPTPAPAADAGAPAQDAGTPAATDGGSDAG